MGYGIRQTWISFSVLPLKVASINLSESFLSIGQFVIVVPIPKVCWIDVGFRRCVLTDNLTTWLEACWPLVNI